MKRFIHKKNSFVNYYIFFAQFIYADSQPVQCNAKKIKIKTTNLLICLWPILCFLLLCINFRFGVWKRIFIKFCQKEGSLGDIFAVIKINSLLFLTLPLILKQIYVISHYWSWNLNLSIFILYILFIWIPYFQQCFKHIKKIINRQSVYIQKLFKKKIQKISTNPQQCKNKKRTIHIRLITEIDCNFVQSVSLHCAFFADYFFPLNFLFYFLFTRSIHTTFFVSNHFNSLN